MKAEVLIESVVNGADPADALDQWIEKYGDQAERD